MLMVLFTLSGFAVGLESQLFPLDTVLAMVLAFVSVRDLLENSSSFRRSVRKTSYGKYSIPVRVLIILACVAMSSALASAQSFSSDEARSIAREAYIYGYPLVENYRFTYSYFVDNSSPQFRAPWNQLRNTSAAASRSQQGSALGEQSLQLGADLRAEPLVLILPNLGRHRYDLIQVIDLFAFDFAYTGSRSTGNEGGSFLLVGPDWKGDKPQGVKDVIRSATQFGFVLYRRQLLAPAELPSRQKTEIGFKVQPLHEFLGVAAPLSAPKVDFMQPVSTDQQVSPLQFFDLLNFVLRFCPHNPSQENLMTRFAKLGIGPDASFLFNPATLSSAMKQALGKGAADALLFEKQEYKLAAEENASDISGALEFLGTSYPRPADGRLDESNPMEEEITYWISVADSSGRRFYTANEFPLAYSDEQVLLIDAILSLGIYEPPLSFLHSSAFDPYWIDGP